MAFACNINLQADLWDKKVEERKEEKKYVELFCDYD